MGNGVFFADCFIIELDGVFDDLQGGGLVPEFLHYNRFVLEFLVLLEEMAQLFEKMARQLFQVIVMVDAGVVGRHRDDLVVGVAAVHHLHDAHYLGLHQAEGLYRQGSNDEDVERVLVVSIGLWDEAIIHGVIEGRVDDPV